MFEEEACPEEFQAIKDIKSGKTRWKRDGRRISGRIKGARKCLAKKARRAV